MRFLLALTAILIAYGSLYPFDFVFERLDRGELDAFLESWRALSSRGDILGNLALFVPFGFLGAASLANGRRRVLRIGLVVALGTALALVLQVAQMYLSGRDASLQDVMWNVAGTLVGSGLGVGEWWRNVLGRGDTRRLVPTLLVATWLTHRLVPFVPSLDFQLIKDSLKPLLRHPQFPLADVALDFIAWLVVACLLEAGVGRRIADRSLPLVMASVWVAEVLIVANVVTAADIAGGALALLAWWSLIRRLERRTTVTSLALVAAIVGLGLAPFELRSGPAAFHWLPFYGLLGESMMAKAQTLLAKMFLYGSLVWLLRSSGVGWAGAAIATVLVTAVIEFAQMRLAGHTPEITDPILVVLAVIIMSVVSKGQEIAEGPRAGNRSTDKPTTELGPN